MKTNSFIIKASLGLFFLFGIAITADAISFNHCLPTDSTIVTTGVANEKRNNSDTLYFNSISQELGQTKAKEEEGKIRRRVPTHTIIFGAGYGWMISEVVTEFDTYKGYGGLNLKFEYNWVGKKGYGFGFLASGFTVDFPYDKVSVGLVAPSFVVAGKVHDKWLIRGRFALGYAWHNEALYGENGMGCDMSWGIEYMLNKHIGLGVNMQYFWTSFYTKESYNFNENRRYGIDVLGLLAGIKFYL